MIMIIVLMMIMMAVLMYTVVGVISGLILSLSLAFGPYLSVSCSAKQLVRGEPNVSYICSRYYRAPELIFGATDYTSSIGKVFYCPLYPKTLFKPHHRHWCTRRNLKTKRFRITQNPVLLYITLKQS